MINSWVHVLMYVYYQLTAVRVNLSENFKKLLTLVQMVGKMIDKCGKIDD